MVKSAAFIGLGAMGSPMAERLIESGYRLRVYDPDGAAVDHIVRKGAEALSSPREAAAGTALVFACLPSPEVSITAALGSDGVGNAEGVETYVEMSTIGSAAIEKIAAELKRKGIAVIDAPVSGGPRGAQSGTLTIMAAGPNAAIEMAREGFGSIARNLFVVGETAGLAQVTKLANNMISAAGMAAACEATALAVKAGVEARVLIDVINASTGRNSATLDKFPTSILPRSFDYGARLSTMYKDVALCFEESRYRGVPMWVGGSVMQLWFHAMTQGRANDDYTTLIKMVEEWAGVVVGGEPAQSRPDAD